MCSNVAKFGADDAIRGAGSVDLAGLRTGARAAASSGSSLASDLVTGVPKPKFVAALEKVLSVDSVEEAMAPNGSGVDLTELGKIWGSPDCRQTPTASKKD
jgi:hypothetical protein